MSNTHLDQPLKREALKLKEIVNLCRGAPRTDWPPEEETWVLRFQDLKRGIEIDGIPIGGKIKDRTVLISFVRLMDLWAFAMARPNRSHWEWLIEFCQSWAKALAVKLPAMDVKPATWKKYLGWHDCAQEKKTDELKSKPTQLAGIVAKAEGADAGTVRRTLDRYFPGWAD